MEDFDSSFSVEDDGSLLILNRVSGESRRDTDNATMSDSLEGLSVKNTVGQDRGLDDILEDDALWDIDQILTKEQENLELIKKSNEIMKNLISCSPKVGTSQESERKTDNSDNQLSVQPLRDSPYQKWMGRITSGFRRRKNAPRPLRPTRARVQALVRDYYQSIGFVSRYILVACIVSFFVAFCLLSWYSAQTHSQDVELFKMHEKQLIAKQEKYENYQLQHQSFREGLIHLRYEETRECHSSLDECHSRRDELLAQIASMGQDATKAQVNLEATVENQRKEIEVLKGKLREIIEQNKDLRREMSQTFSQTYAQLLMSIFNFFKNKSTQILIGTVIILVVMAEFVSMVFKK